MVTTRDCHGEQTGRQRLPEVETCLPPIAHFKVLSWTGPPLLCRISFASAGRAAGAASASGEGQGTLGFRVGGLIEIMGLLEGLYYSKLLKV